MEMQEEVEMLEAFGEGISRIEDNAVDKNKQS